MPAPKNYIKIQYPRKCEHCDYVSNNPSMYHYHKKTHEKIPHGKLCDHGCGQPAKFINTKGSFTCDKISQRCPEYIKQHSDRIKDQWAGDYDRKEKTRKSFIERLHNQETVKRIQQTKLTKSGLLDPETAKEYRRYARLIRCRSQKWAKSQGYILGQQTYHVDHKLSILDAWHAKLSIDVVSHPVNLQILEAKENSSKGAKSVLTVEELLKEISILYAPG
jgi:hypothetical protein